MIYRARNKPTQLLKQCDPDPDGFVKPFWLAEWVACDFFKDEKGHLYALAHGQREQSGKPKHEDRAREEGEQVISTWYEVSAA